MTLRRYVAWPDKRLRSPAAPIEAVTDEIRTLWDDMIETMDAMPGVGLAAPQIGVMLQVAVVDASEARNKRIRLANPVIVDASAVLHPYEEASPTKSRSTSAPVSSRNRTFTPRGRREGAVP